MALPKGIESTQELLEAQAHIWKHIGHTTTSQALRCAIQLGIPDIIHKHGKPMTLSEAGAALSIHESKVPHLGRFMRLLVHSGFLAEEEGVGYWLNPVSRLLLREEPLSAVQFVALVHDPRLGDPWDHMGEWLRGDRPTPFEVARGVPVWEAARGEGSMNEAINEGMASDARLVASAIVRDYPEIFAGIGSMVDVGGGTGATAAVVARAFPNMKCAVLDLPHVVSGSKGTGNLEFIGGDMFDTIPAADAVLLKVRKDLIPLPHFHNEIDDLICVSSGSSMIGRTRSA